MKPVMLATLSVASGYTRIRRITICVYRLWGTSMYNASAGPHPSWFLKKIYALPSWTTSLPAMPGWRHLFINVL